MCENIGHVSYWAKMWGFVGQLMALNARLEGMKALNKDRQRKGFALGYEEKEFGDVADEMEAIAEKLETEI